MKLGIDASNIRSGGGVIHLQKILEQADQKKHSINQVIVWGGETPLKYLPVKPWLDLQNISVLNQKKSQRFFWQQIKLLNTFIAMLYWVGGQQMVALVKLFLLFGNR